MTLSKTEARNILDFNLPDILNLLKKINTNRFNNNITFSRNVFLPLTHICQNNCGYCTFKETPENTDILLMNPTQVDQQIFNAINYKCTEALFTFGESADKNELIQEKLKEYHCETMVDYVYKLSKATLNNYDILPHTNMGIISKDQLHQLAKVNASMGLMLETTNKSLLKTIAHKDSPGKNPKKRINYIKNAGKEKIPFTTGLLIGIGESKEDHIDSLFEIKKLHEKYGHIQEIIIQNFTPKKGIPMENYPEPPIIDLIKLTILSNIMFPDVSIQIPPNLNQKLISIFTIAGADDLGGISPITKDYVNPDAPWPKIDEIKQELNSINYNLVERLPVYKKYINKNYLREEVYEKTVKLQKRIETN
ncbi:7,8-didemethyl-8-hydroxy-5-deazariboflavin synthase subunit CofG [Methanosphaera sp. WGK6]|uniref:7,8-didemethyl-8-hydroxy-5-deazariboflavin synthase subunit CofG n=1 Tax=Methanosphaera sp. WGK6 TaxID=1561964 RepID=UPI00084C4287|nr:7,8-didemethyl-8-hydroxy-5-deazariboflavin synthase subunit CofG [Methanosphaera sp. WGK6]OED30235.1 FO synthase subunit 1 [Methanosphaera sp. WGK6]